MLFQGLLQGNYEALTDLAVANAAEAKQVGFGAAQELWMSQPDLNKVMDIDGPPHLKYALREASGSEFSVFQDGHAPRLVAHRTPGVCLPHPTAPEGLEQVEDRRPGGGRQSVVHQSPSQQGCQRPVPPE